MSWRYTPGSERPPEKYSQTGEHAWEDEAELARRRAIWDAAQKQSPQCFGTEGKENIQADDGVSSTDEHKESDRAMHFNESPERGDSDGHGPMDAYVGGSASPDEFENLAALDLCRDVITVVRDPRAPLGKSFTRHPDGTVSKKAVVAITEGVAVMHHLPDSAAMKPLWL